MMASLPFHETSADLPSAQVPLSKLTLHQHEEKLLSSLYLSSLLASSFLAIDANDTNIYLYDLIHIYLKILIIYLCLSVYLSYKICIYLSVYLCISIYLYQRWAKNYSFGFTVQSQILKDILVYRRYSKY